MKSLNSLLAITVLFACACTVGDSAQPDPDSSDFDYLDTNGDGEYDAVDVNLDGIPDYTFDSSDCESCDQAITAQAWCSPLVDSDGDGNYEGLDWNCDGIIDVPLSQPSAGGGGDGGSSGGGSSSNCRVTVNNRTVACESVDGGDYECTCSEDGEVVLSCSTDSNSACSIPGNCCGF